MRDTNSEVRVEIGNPTDQQGDSWVTVAVVDGPSGEMLAEFEMDPAKWYRLLHGGSERVPAFITPHRDRIGKSMEVTRASVPPDLRWKRDLRDDEVLAAMVVPEGWENYESASVRRTNTGPEVVLRRWV